MASQADICNRALQRLGESKITSINEDSPQARYCLSAWDMTRDAEFRRNRWGFTIKRASLAASATAPIFGKAAAYPLPSNYILLIPDNTVTDWVIESHTDSSGNDLNAIITDDSAPIQIRYCARITNTGLYDALFAEGLAARLAYELAEVVTQSTQKQTMAAAWYKDVISDARKTNAIEKPSDVPPASSWETERDA